MPLHLPPVENQTHDNVLKLRTTLVASKVRFRSNIITLRLKKRVSVPAPSDTICNLLWVLELIAASMSRSMERVRTYVPSLSFFRMSGGNLD